MIGSAWATIGLMFPIMMDLLQSLLHLAPHTPVESVELILPLVGATLLVPSWECIFHSADNSMMSAAVRSEPS